MNFWLVIAILSIGVNIYLFLERKKKSGLGILEDYLFMAFENFVKDEMKKILLKIETKAEIENDDEGEGGL